MNSLLNTLLWMLVSLVVFARTSGESTPAKSDLLRVIWTGKGVVAVGDRGTILNSADGVEWNSGRITDPAGDAIELSQLACSGQTMVVAGNVPGVVWNSNDGTAWKRIALGFPAQISSLIWTGDQFSGIAVYAGSQPSFLFFSSPDGTHWSYSPIVIPHGLINEIIWTGHRYVSFYFQDTAPDNWMHAFEPFGRYPVNPTLKRIVAVSSENGKQWSSTLAASSEKLHPPCGIIWTGKKVVIIGTDGSAYSSLNGLLWTKGSLGLVDKTIDRAMWTGREVAALGYTNDNPQHSREPVFLTSLDASAWSPRPLSLPGRYELMSIIWTGSQYVAVGTEGLIQTSPDGNLWTLRGQELSF